jgi:DNA-binding IclR family transcriptional regulator
VLAAADGARTVSDLARATALGEFETTRAVYRLLELGYLRL